MNIQRTLAVRLPTPALAQGWWPLRLRDGSEAAEKVLALWLNSTFGVLMFAAHRTPSAAGAMVFKRQTVQSLPVLDVFALSPALLASIASAYETIAARELGSFADLAEDTVRADIDSLFCRALAIPSVDPLRRALAREPVLTHAPCEEGDEPATVEAQHEFEVLL